MCHNLLPRLGLSRSGNDWTASTVSLPVRFSLLVPPPSAAGRAGRGAERPVDCSDPVINSAGTSPAVVWAYQLRQTQTVKLLTQTGIPNCRCPGKLIVANQPVDSVHVFTVNEQLILDRAHVLKQGDELTVIPPAVGG